MVSLRRRRLLGLSSGVQNDAVVDPVPMLLENGNASENDGITAKTARVNPILLDYDLNLPPRDVDDTFEECGTPIVYGCSQREYQNTQPNASVSTSSKESTPEPEVKRRKQYRRRNADDHVPMKGVYLKNLRWQAAIKVDGKQIHLGTLSSQEEAVHLYDRAAFIRGRETNKEISEEEKQELRKLNWDDFLTMTRKAITTKRTRRMPVKRPAPDSVQISDNEGKQGTEPLSTSDDAELDR